MVHREIMAVCFVLLALSCSAQTVQLDGTDSDFKSKMELMERLACDPGFMLLEHGASIGRVDAFYLGEQPKLPILDENGNVHPASCNPHINFIHEELDKEKLESLLPHLRKLLPDDRASHVALHLPKTLFDEKRYVEYLQKQLPRCQIFHEHHIANSHNIPINRRKH